MSLPQKAHPGVLDTEIIVVGGGPAGLQAAMSIGRMHRDAVVFDSGRYRNELVEHMHNLVGFDGTSPADFRAAARTQVQTYSTIDFRSAEVETIERTCSTDGDSFFTATTADGEVTKARAVVLATGVADTVAPVEGLKELWGTVAAQCPFCHGHEYEGQPIAIIGGAAASHMAMFLHRITSDITVVPNGETIEPAARSYLESVGATIIEASITRIERVDGGAQLHFANHSSAFVAGIFTVPTLSQRAPFAAQLGLELNPSGCVRIDDFGVTSVPGVYAAGDMAHIAALPMPMASVAMAVAAGQTAATAALRFLG